MSGSVKTASLDEQTPTPLVNLHGVLAFQRFVSHTFIEFRFVFEG